jgi:hypothetical protein
MVSREDTCILSVLLSSTILLLRCDPDAIRLWDEPSYGDNWGVVSLAFMASILLGPDPEAVRSLEVSFTGRRSGFVVTRDAVEEDIVGALSAYQSYRGSRI